MTVCRSPQIRVASPSVQGAVGRAGGSGSSDDRVVMDSPARVRPRRATRLLCRQIIPEVVNHGGGPTSTSFRSSTWALREGMNFIATRATSPSTARHPVPKGRGIPGQRATTPLASATTTPSVARSGTVMRLRWSVGGSGRPGLRHPLARSYRPRVHRRRRRSRAIAFLEAVVVLEPAAMNDVKISVAQRVQASRPHRWRLAMKRLSQFGRHPGSRLPSASRPGMPATRRSHQSNGRAC